jgi:hypothetical protein
MLRFLNWKVWYIWTHSEYDLEEMLEKYLSKLTEINYLVDEEVRF